MKKLQDLDTPALLIDLSRMKKNIRDMQEKANTAGVHLRPHTKTHRTPALAFLQLEAGAHGIAVAKIGEAEVMAKSGIDDIFIASVTMGKQKIERLKKLAFQTKVMIGVDDEEQVMELSAVFTGERKPIDVLIEIETGEERTGLVPGERLVRLARFIKKTPGIRLKGVFSHEGHTYGASTADECRVLFKKSQEDTLRAAELIRTEGISDRCNQYWSNAVVVARRSPCPELRKYGRAPTFSWMRHRAMPYRITAGVRRPCLQLLRVNPHPTGLWSMPAEKHSRLLCGQKVFALPPDTAVSRGLTISD